MQSRQYMPRGPVNPGWFAAALQILILIERSGGGKVCSSGDLASQLHAHAVFLRRIFARLVRAGIAEAREGRDGGYLLARPAEQITLADVYRALQSNETGATLPFELPRGLELEHSLCHAFSDIGAEVDASILRTLERHTLAELAGRARGQEAERAASAL